MPRDWMNDELDDEEQVYLTKYRGGCSCHLSPPCHNCCSPVTETEAEILEERFGNPEGSNYEE